jgi:hypothetical protein
MVQRGLRLLSRGEGKEVGIFRAFGCWDIRLTTESLAMVLLRIDT